ncbi:MAG: LLM class F420-dependent oxidoreductase [Desertimonas sp.]
MRLGIVAFPTETGLGPVELAAEVEARGFASLWVPEHSHIPTSRRSPWGGRKDAPELPPYYWHGFDQFVSLAAAAAVTSTITLGTGISLVAQRDPLWLAKEVATLDQVSGGRFVLGMGFGWNHEEMAHHGVDIERRRDVAREHILACKALWTQDEAEFHGEHVDFEPSWAWPKPLQRPHPPIVIGAAATPVHLRHIIEYADGWMPLPGRFPVTEGWSKVLAAADEAGRDRSTLQLGVFGAAPERGGLEELRALGANWVTLNIDPLDRDRALHQLDGFAPLVDEFNR